MSSADLPNGVAGRGFPNASLSAFVLPHATGSGRVKINFSRFQVPTLAGGYSPNIPAVMQLSEFILRNMEAILVEWEGFASTLQPAAASITPLALRDHAQQILEAVAKDISIPQSKQEQAEKSKGKAPRIMGAPETAAETHAILRAKDGFDIKQLAAEYRALRASVLRLWLDACRSEAPDLEDVIRFNEAVDQAVAESISFFSARVEQARNLLLGMLGHDMRSPLNTILATASHLAALHSGEEISAAASRLIRSGASLKALLDDLVDFNRTELGLGIKISRADADLAPVFADELEQLRVVHPERELKLEAIGDTRGRWDRIRLQQAFRNLMTNALKYGSASSPVHVVLIGEETEVRFEVTNRGPTIEQSDLARIFDPLVRGCAKADDRFTRGGLGLGLYIVREVVRAHGGRVVAQSGEGKTVFVVWLPRCHQGASI